MQLMEPAIVSATASAMMARPPSPTLTNPDMILPYGVDDYELEPSASSHDLYPSHGAPPTWRGGKLDDNQYAVAAPLRQVHSPTTPIIYGNGTMLSDIGEVTEVENTPRKLPGPAERRAIKQALGLARSTSTLAQRAKPDAQERRLSMDSTSTITSDIQQHRLFRDFDDSLSVDDSVFQGDDEESVAESYRDDASHAELGTSGHDGAESADEEDPNSSAALSRRAERILLNAKKRLNNMEGNLFRARTSLSVHSGSASSPGHSRNSSVNSTLGVQSQFQSKSQSPLANSPGHSRVHSENSIPVITKPVPFRIRSVSANGYTRNRIDSKLGSPNSLGSDVLKEESGLETPRNKSPPHHAAALAPLHEDPSSDVEGENSSVISISEEQFYNENREHSAASRAASALQMRGLQDQMQDLKGRLSVLRDRARDDTMKRRSMQSLRTPSPFTAAEQWYTGNVNYKEGGLSADAGIGHSPRNSENPHSLNLTPVEDKVEERPVSISSAEESVYEDVSEGDKQPTAVPITSNAEPLPHNTDGQNEFVSDGLVHHQKEERRVSVVHDDDELLTNDDSEYESDGKSLYHDAYSTAISHEDREDAFDYEHFFLHSAMGTISQQAYGRRDSIGSSSSQESIETARGPITVDGAANLDMIRFRSESQNSLSTIATFATATEGFGSENEARNSHPQFATYQHSRSPSPPLTAKRSSFAPLNGISETNVNGSKRASAAISPLEPNSKGTFSAAGLRTAGPRSSIISIANRLQSPAIDKLPREDQILVERLLDSLGQCVLGLQDAGRASYESRVFRRKLDAARRILEGQEEIL